MSGDLSISLKWNDIHDLDLYACEPSGRKVTGVGTPKKEASTTRGTLTSSHRVPTRCMKPGLVSCRQDKAYSSIVRLQEQIQRVQDFQDHVIRTQLTRLV
jgi:hypothetical protein